jgi:hypothetical protein
MLTNDTVNLMTLCSALSLAARYAGTTLTASQLPVLQLRSCCALRDIIASATSKPRFLIHPLPALMPSRLPGLLFARHTITEGDKGALLGSTVRSQSPKVWLSQPKV